MISKLTDLKPNLQWVLAIDLEANGAHPEADSKILIKNQNLNSLVDQERQVVDDAKAALGGKYSFCALNELNSNFIDTISLTL